MRHCLNETEAENQVDRFWTGKGFSTPQKDVSELFTSQTKEPDTILQNTRINIRLLDCDSFPAYHFELSGKKVDGKDEEGIRGRG